MQFLNLLSAFISGFSYNVPLGLLFGFFYFFNSYITYKYFIYFSQRISFLRIFLPFLFTILWVYGELRSAGIIIYWFDTTDFVFSSSSFLGSLFVLFSSSALLGVFFSWIFHNKKGSRLPK